MQELGRVVVTWPGRSAGQGLQSKRRTSQFTVLSVTRKKEQEDPLLVVSVEELMVRFDITDSVNSDILF